MAHEFSDDTMEAAPCVSVSLLAGAERTEVLGGFRNDIRSQLHNDLPSGGTTDGDVEEYFGVLGHG